MNSERYLVRSVLIGLVLSCLQVGFGQTASDILQWTATAKRAPSHARSASAYSLELRARISPGWHLYALDQPSGGPMRTVIQLAAGQGFVVAGDIKQPDPIVNYDPNFAMEVRYFADEVSFIVPLNRVPGSKAQNNVALAVTFQSCNDHTCLPPTTIKVPIKLTSVAARANGNATGRK